MDQVNWIEVVDKLGLPTAVALYLLYFNLKQTKFHNTVLNDMLQDIKNIMVNLSSQITYMLNGMLNYRSNNTDIGDESVKQAIYVGDKLNNDYSKCTRSRSTTQKSKDGDGDE